MYIIIISNYVHIFMLIMYIYNLYKAQAPNGGWVHFANVHKIIR